MRFSAVILAGGKSSRMGRDKAWLEVGGQTLLARQIGLVRETGASEIFISGRADADYSSFGCRVLKDKFQNAGPLAGIERALDASTNPLLLILAVDMPNMTGEFLRRLVMDCSGNFGAIPRINGRTEPLVALYPKAAGPMATRLLKEGFNAATYFAESCEQNNLAAFVDMSAQDACFFENWNEPRDIAKELI